MSKKLIKNFQLNFYQFQIRESKKQKIVELREKFEADKKKVERMKQDRKFKPMTAWVIYLTNTYIYEVIIYPWLHGKVDFWTEASQMVLEPIKFWHFHFINII